MGHLKGMTNFGRRSQQPCHSETLSKYEGGKGYRDAGRQPAPRSLALTLAKDSLVFEPFEVVISENEYQVRRHA
jgi:hypothetical protein